MGLVSRRLGSKGLSWSFQWDGFTPTNADRTISGSVSGMSITTDRSMGYSPFWAAVRVLSETVAQLPLVIYRRLPGGGKERAAHHSLYPILHTAPNPEMTSFIWRETGQGHAVSWGNHYSEIVRDRTDTIRELWPLAPDRMQKKRAADGTIFFRYQKSNGEQRDLEARQVFHLPGLGWDGFTGYSVLSMAREAIGLGLSAEAFGATFFAQGATTKGIIAYPGDLDQPQADALREKFDGRHGGTRNAHRTGVLTNGATYTSTSIPPEDAQFLQTRKFQVTEIARMFRLPPHLIGDLEHATFTNIEQQSLEFVKYSMLPWLTRWEQQIQKDLIQDDQYFAEFLVDGLERADAVTRATALQIRRQNGTLNADQWRATENENPLDDGAGQEFWQPLNMGIVGRDDPIKIDIVTKMIAAGFDPQETLAAFGVSPIKHLGLPPRSLQQAQLLDPNDPTSLYLGAGPTPPDAGTDVGNPTATLVAAAPKLVAVKAKPAGFA